MAQQAGTATVFMKDSTTRANGGVLNVLASWSTGDKVVTGVTVTEVTNTSSQYKASYTLTLGATATKDDGKAFQAALDVDKAVPVGSVKVYEAGTPTHPVVVEQPPDQFSFTVT